jgi:hypothetical protein
LRNLSIEKYGDIVAPINDLTKKDIHFEWTPACDEAQRLVREALKDCPALKPLNYEWTRPGELLGLLYTS